MAEIEHVVLLHDRRGWSVKVVLSEGGSRRYRYGSEAQARFFAAVFQLGPRVLPPTPRAQARKQKQAQPATLPVESLGALSAGPLG